MQEKTHCSLTAKTDTDVPSDLRHFAYKQIATVTISMQKTLFYTSNATSTNHYCCIFNQLLANVCSVKRQMCCNIELETSYNSKTSLNFKSPKTLPVFQSIHLHSTTELIFFSVTVCMKFKNIFLIIQILLICCKI